MSEVQEAVESAKQAQAKAIPMLEERVARRRRSNKEWGRPSQTPEVEAGELRALADDLIALAYLQKNQ